MLGGGMVPGSIVLLGGDPGIGKSTLMLQVALELAGEKTRAVCLRRRIRTADQNARRACFKTGQRQANLPHPEHLYLVTETNLDVILAHVEQLNPHCWSLIPSRPYTWTGLSSSAGSVSQVRECASRLRELAKASGIAVFLIGHVTKEGIIAGPRVLEHIVDTVLQLEGDRFQSYRLLRSMKNRFGPTSEVGVFEMRRAGHGRSDQPVGSISGRTHERRAGFSHRGDHGRHPPACWWNCRG